MWTRWTIRSKCCPTQPTTTAYAWPLFRAIYKDQGLAGYGFGGDTWRAFTRNEHEILYFEREPLGIYPIHIIVKHGNVILVGLVASQEDKNLAGIKANGVSGVFSVTNNLRVDTRMQSP